MAKATYKDAGVDLELYADAMARLPRLLRRTHTPRVLPLEGGFAGLFQLDFASALFSRRYQDPVLVACTDGVGTKLKVATAVGVHNTVGIDLVAMSVNDAVCCGAEPLFFLDYIAMPKDDPPLLEQLVEGISAGCIQCDCALLGGETAILPDLYAPGDYDLAGFCVGVVSRESAIDGQSIAAGDVVIGLASTGLHSNGYSLARKIAFEIGEMAADSHVEELGTTLGQAMLTPTRIYARPIRQVLTYYRVKHVVHGIAHITGGGLHENLARIVPEGVEIVIDRGSWPVPPIFRWLERVGDVEPAEMDRVFNMGVGMVLVVRPFYAESIRSQLADMGVDNWLIGRAREGPRGVVWSE
ncbi:MAG: phosphoribosylformylglycinamidine cyclo-ligase [Rhodopirellula sp.]|nr:phosphoribosylformylglycinamidine cyclo-ligase [Rhodopirellula sp.]